MNFPNVLAKQPKPRLDDATVERIGQEEVASWTDPRFAGVDLPKRIGEQGADLSFYDQSFMEGKTAGPPKVKDFDTGVEYDAPADDGSLTDFLVNLPGDKAALSDPRLAGHPEVANELLEVKLEAVAQEFRRRCPKYFADENFENLDAIVQFLLAKYLFREDIEDMDEGMTLLGQSGLWTVANLEDAFHALSKEGALVQDPNQLRTISTKAYRDLQQMASMFGPADALDNYVRQRLPENFFECCDNATEAMTRLADPQWHPVVLEAIWLVFTTLQTDFSDDAQHTRRDWLLKYTSQAGFPTYPRMLAGWQQLKQVITRQNFQPLRVPETEPSQENFEALSDEQVADLMHQTLRAAARG